MEPRAKTMIERLGFADGDRKTISHDEIQLWAYRNFRRIIKIAFPLLDVNTSSQLDVKLEYPITDGTRNFVVGFVDVFCKQYSIGIEVKTVIPVIGDLIRQIQFYRQYKDATWVVVSPDDRNSDIIREQGIAFIKYKYDQGDSNGDQLNLFL